MDSRDTAIRAACINAKWNVKLTSLDKRQVQHSRSLEFNLQSGKTVKIWLDQGFGYWKIFNGNRFFPFTATPDEQAKKITDIIMNKTTMVDGRDFETCIFIEIP